MSVEAVDAIVRATSVRELLFCLHLAEAKNNPKAVLRKIRGIAQGIDLKLISEETAVEAAMENLDARSRHGMRLD